jgi:4-amino-4-deoxy-L-arabinose transferase-like glycosyltransferase
MMRTALTRAPLVFALSFAIAGLIGLALPASIRSARSDDYRHAYEPVARRLVEGKGLTMPDGTPAIRYPPGHSFVLAAIFSISQQMAISESWALGLFPIVMHAVSAVLIFNMTREIFDTRAAWIATLLWSTYVPALYAGLLLNSETSFIPILLLAMLTGWRANRASAATAGALFGVSMLIRPIAVGLPLVFAAWRFTEKSLSWRQRTTEAALLVVSAAVIVAPWQVWMRIYARETQMLSSGGLPSVIDGLTFCRSSQSRAAVSISEDVHAMAADLHAQYRTGLITDIPSLGRWMLRQVWTNPPAIARLLLAKVGRSWYGTDSHRFERELLLLQLPYLAAAIFSCGICLRQAGSARRFAFVSIIVVGYFWLMTIAVLSILRYMVPVMPLVLILCAALVDRGLPKQRIPAIAS